MSAVAPPRFAILVAALTVAFLPNAQAVSLLGRSDRGPALRTSGPIEVIEAHRALLASQEVVDHATIHSAADEAMPRVSRCASHLDTLIRHLDRHYTDVQLQTVLVNFCRTSEEYSKVPGFEDGFRNLKECESFAKRLVEARDAELTGEEGSDSGYTGLCKAYINSNGRVNPPMPKPRKVKVAAERAEPKPEVVKEETKGLVLKPGYGSNWWLVACGLLLTLILAALLICCATRSPKQLPPGMSSQDMLRPIDSDERDQWGDIAETIFDTYDLDKNGFLEKEECKKVLEQVAKCVADKYRRRWGSSVPPAHVAEIQNRIKWDFDLHFDGKISKQEFMKNIKRILDDLEFGSIGGGGAPLGSRVATETEARPDEEPGGEGTKGDDAERCCREEVVLGLILLCSIGVAVALMVVYGPTGILREILRFMPDNPGWDWYFGIYAIIVLAIVLLVPIWPPLCMVAGLIFGLAWGVLLNFSALLTAAVISLALGRLLLREPMRRRIEEGDYHEARQLMAVIEDSGSSLQFLVLFRFLFLPMPIRNYAPATLNVEFWKLVVACIPHSFWISIIFASSGSTFKDTAHLLRGGKEFSIKSMKWQDLSFFLVSFSLSIYLAYYAHKKYSEQIAAAEQRVSSSVRVSEAAVEKT